LSRWQRAGIDRVRRSRRTRFWNDTTCEAGRGASAHLALETVRRHEDRQHGNSNIDDYPLMS
jgi:hypothetical protein